MLWLLLAIVISRGASEQSVIVSPPKNVTGQLGGTAEFTCKLVFKVVRIMAWHFNKIIVYSYQNGEEDYPAGRGKYTVQQDGRNFKLTVQNLQCNDGGRYTCSEPSQAKGAYLFVLDRPKVFAVAPIAVEGCTAEYICTTQFSDIAVSPDHFPQLQMLLDDVEMNATEVKLEREDSTNCYNVTQILSITLDASMHGMLLQCDIGTSNPLKSTMTIQVLYSVRNITYTPHRELYAVGAVINCTADGNPPPHFLWRDMKNRDRNFTRGKLLQITKDMVGSSTWRCTAENIINGSLYQDHIEAVFDAVIPKMGANTLSEPRNDSWKIAVGVTVPICIGIASQLVIYICRRFGKSGPSCESPGSENEHDAHQPMLHDTTV